MRVVHLCHVPLPPTHPDYGRLHSHPGRWVVNLAMAQKAHTDVDPVLVTMVPGATADFFAEIDGLKVHFIKLPARFRSATLFEFERRKLARVATGLKPDFVHAHGTEESYVLAAQKSRLPYLVTAQGLFSQINHIMPPKLVSRARIQEWMERRALSKARDIIAKSEYVAEWIRSQYPRLNIHRIPNTFHPSLLQIPETAKEPGSAVFVGMVTPRKGLDLLADVLEANCGRRIPVSPDSSGSASFLNRLHIVGNKGHGGTEYDRAILARLQGILGDRLVLHGIVPSSEVASLVSRCEILVAPSLEEMFGNQVIEALMAGTWPVVSSQTAMAENVLRVGAGTIFTNGDTASLHHALEKAFSGLGKWDREGTRQSVIDWMGPGVVARQHRELYKKILNQKSANYSA